MKIYIGKFDISMSDFVVFKNLEPLTNLLDVFCCFNEIQTFFSILFNLLFKIAPVAVIGNYVKAVVREDEVLEL